MNVGFDKNVGEIIGIYNILGICDHKDYDGHKLYNVECTVCGKQNNMRLYDIRHVTKCTHINKHGNYKNCNSYHWNNKRIGNIFRSMIGRCYNSNNKSYRWYGAKGIKIYNEWIDNPKLFEEWAVANGYSDEMTIDRIDENKDYCPENCRWITNVNNAKYKSTTLLIKVNDEIHTGREWSEVLGFGVNQINKYIRKYGIENVIEFIRRYKNNPTLKPKNRQSYYDLYMNNDIRKSD